MKNDKNKLQHNPFKEIFKVTMTRRWWISLVIMLTFLLIIIGVVLGVNTDHKISSEWKELIILMLGAFLGSFNKVIDYWFSDVTKDKMFADKMDDEADKKIGDCKEKEEEIEEK
jgi:hypothetical protein